jgi:hypothetical protein
MCQVFHLDNRPGGTLAGLTPAEARELEALEREIPSLADWDAYTMQPISEHEKRWAYLSQKHVDAMERQAVDN